MQPRTIKTSIEYRALSLDTRTIDESARTVEVAFSSEEPVERWFGDEILDHAPESVRLGRLQDGAPVLKDHGMRDQVGVVESAEIGVDRVGRAVLRFGKNPDADAEFKDVVDGIRTKVSVGYRIHRLRLEEETDEKDIYRALDWEPYEISMVSIPADNSVGVGRQADQQFTTEVIRMDPKKPAGDDPATRSDPPASPPAPVAPVVDVGGDLDKLRNAELDRMDTIQAIGDKYDCADLARKYIAEKRSAEEMTTAVLELVATRQAESRPPTELGLSPTDTQRYSILRAIRAAMTNDWSRAGYELECSQGIEDALDREARGFFVPYEVQKRVMTVGTNADGGFLKGTDHMGGSFIELLRDDALLGSLGARILPGLVGDVDIPRLDGGATFGWLAEDGDASDSDGSLGQVLLSPKTIGGAVPISRRLLKQSSPAVEDMMMEDLAAGAALAIDLAGFEGTGASNQPSGITVTTGVGTSTIASAGSPTHVELVEFETDVANAKALSGMPAYVTTATVRGNLKTTALDAGSGRFLMEQGEANGYPVRVTTQLSANRIIFGNFADVVIGLWGVLDLMPDMATKAASGGLVLRAFQDVDIGIRHAGSFSINA